MRRHGTQEQLAEILTQRLPVGTEPKMALLAAGALIAVVTTIFEFWVEDFDDAETFTFMDRALEAVVDGFGLGGRSETPPRVTHHLPFGKARAWDILWRSGRVRPQERPQVPAPVLGAVTDARRRSVG